MAILIEMSRWITYSGPTQENWNLRWYPDRVVVRYMGSNFSDFILRNDPILPEGLGEPGETRLHEKSYSIDINQISGVVFIRRRPFLLPRLEFVAGGKKVSFYTRDKSARPLQEFQKLREFFPGRIEFSVK